MRLTLRTLLAYLDDTLDEKDAEVIRSKLEDSGFATQLVQRIRANLANPNIAAPPADSVHPLSEANMMSEYLDSTLSPEQVAEIERACLESEMHLGEAAAAHQILTMALGKPAEVTDDLRARIYEIGEDKADSGSSTASFSALDVPSGAPPMIAPDQPMDQDGIATADAPGQASVLSKAATAEPVRPVGAGDSGVHDAVTRMRESGVMDETDDNAGPAIAGDRARQKLERSDLYEGGVRPSRIMPWLVSLALAAIFLFAVSQIFSGLFPGSTVANNDDENMSSILNEENKKKRPDSEIVVPADQAPPMESVGTPGVNINESGVTPPPSSDDSSNENLPKPVESSDVASQKNPDLNNANTNATPGDALPMPKESAEVTVEPKDPSLVSPTPDPTDPLPVPTDPAPVPTDPSPTTEDPNSAKPSEPAGKETDGNDAPMVAANDADTTAPGTNAGTPDPPEAPTKVGDPPKDDPDPNADPGANAVARLITRKALLVVPDANTKWKRIAADDTIGLDQSVVCAPEFRADFVVGDHFKISLVGPARMKISDDIANPTLNLHSGRVVIETLKPQTGMKLNIGGVEASIVASDIGTRIAVAAEFARAPGMDPLIDQNHQAMAMVMSVNRSIVVQANGGDTMVDVGKQWFAPQNEASEVIALDPVPTWIDPEVEQPGSLDAEAREALLELIGDDPLMVALREALSFRRNEVVALAAKTSLSLGAADVFFGADGVFGDPKQRSHWQSHFAALRTAIDRDAETASEIRDAIVRVDAADANRIFKLLTGFTKNQLVEGGDQDLIDWLDSPSMSIRVLAFENLRDITGSTLNYRAEEESPRRREAAVKKWSAKQRRGEIRL